MRDLMGSQRLLGAAIDVLAERAEAMADAQWEAETTARLEGMGNG